MVVNLVFQLKWPLTDFQFANVRFSWYSALHVFVFFLQVFLKCDGQQIISHVIFLKGDRTKLDVSYQFSRYLILVIIFKSLLILNVLISHMLTDICKGGESYEGGKCNLCPTGFYANQGATSCIKCPLGTTTISKISPSADNCCKLVL